MGKIVEKVQITEREDGRIALLSPYNPACPAAAKKLGGKWDRTAKAWTFDRRDRERVREMARKIYGTDGATPTEEANRRALEEERARLTARIAEIDARLNNEAEAPPPRSIAG